MQPSSSLMVNSGGVNVGRCDSSTSLEDEASSLPDSDDDDETTSSSAATEATGIRCRRRDDAMVEVWVKMVVQQQTTDGKKKKTKKIIADGPERRIKLARGHVRRPPFSMLNDVEAGSQQHTAYSRQHRTMIASTSSLTPLSNAADPSSSTPAAAVARSARGRPSDDVETRHSKSLSYILRHGATKEGLVLRDDGFVRVDLLVRFSCFVVSGLALARSLSNLHRIYRYQLLTQ